MAEKINMPAGFGGLMRYNEEYPSKLKLDPKHVIIFIILLLVFSVFLRIFWPIGG
ncbi:MAG: preprotein translocase subunit Sec61beta [Nanoarchaeota archaeon]|nr:preprotein translocase subunit Sec61beta [Nanoarchaeota archaeon]